MTGPVVPGAVRITEHELVAMPSAATPGRVHAEKLRLPDDAVTLTVCTGFQSSVPTPDDVSVTVMVHVEVVDSATGLGTQATEVVDGFLGWMLVDPDDGMCVRLAPEYVPVMLKAEIVGVGEL